jgi:lysozyme family protein
MDEKFLSAIDKTLEHEGGYVNDPHDPGGETNYGISKRSYPNLDIKHLTREQAIEIYHRDWWDRYGYGRIDNAELAAKVFDLAVNMGPRRAHKLLQQAINRCTEADLMVDSRIGPKTIAAVNACPGKGLLLGILKGLAIEFYESLNKPRYLKGWTRRALA